MPIYRCKGKGCNYATDNLDAYIQHVIDEKLHEAPPKEPGWEEEKPAKRHRTMKEYLECPQCYPRFEKGALEHPKVIEELEKRGYVKKEKRRGLGL